MLLGSAERTLVFDSEADGLLDTVTRMWCVVAEDYHTDEMFLFHDFPEYDGFQGVDESGKAFTLPKRNGTLQQGVVFIHKAKKLICHNACGYDFELMQKYYPKFRIRYKYSEIRDTLLESQLQWYDRPPVLGYKGIHGLAVWGARLGVAKPEIKDWTTMDPLKLHRCLEDVTINKLTAKYLEREAAGFKEEMGIDFTDALNIEHEYRYWSTKQELYGALVDKEHMEECVVELDGLITKYRDEIEPDLPPTLDVVNGTETLYNVLKGLGKKEKYLPLKKFDSKMLKGILTPYELKEAYKPSMKWFNDVKKRKYGVALKKTDKVLIGYTFEKVKDARAWVKENYPDKKTNQFIYPWKEVTVSEIGKKTREYFEDDAELIDGPFTKVRFSKSRMSQHDKVKLMLVGLGWKALEWTFEKEKKQFKRADMAGEVRWPADHTINGNQLVITYKKGERIPRTPQVTKESYVTMPDGVGEQIKFFNAYDHRRKFIKNPTNPEKGLLNNIRPDGRVSCGLTTFGTTAGRASQYNWVNAPGLGSIYGEEIRKIIIAPEGKTLLGIDMPSAHPRLLADFTQNAKFIAAVDGKEEEEDGTYVGEDFHTVNSILFNLNREEEVLQCVKTQLHDAIRTAVDKGRKDGKGASYCTLYGGSAKKLATILNISEAKAQSLIDNFLKGLGLDKVLNSIQKSWNKFKHKKGSFIKVLGNCWVWCNSKHKIINYKALGSEAVVQKVAVVLLCRKLRELDLDAKLILNIHDEVLLEVDDKDLDEVKPIAANMYVAAAKELGLTLDWSSVAKAGLNYCDCH